VAGAVIILAIWVGSLLPNPPHVGGGDKLHHFAAYAFATGWWCALLRKWSQQILTITVLCLMGVIIEFLQGATGFRHFEVADMFANGLGAICGGLITFWLPASRFEPKRT
jgi:VanZ family protein